jgi:triacylglycerol lipase
MHRSVRQSIADAIADVDANTRITVLGHSLGGAMAMIAAVDLKRNMGKRRVDVCTLGGPRVGKAEFRLRFNREIPDCFRIVNNADFVPRVPFVITGWSHVGREIEVDGQIDNPHSLDAYLAGLQRLGDFRETGVAAAVPEAVLEGVLGTPRQPGVIALRTV